MIKATIKHKTLPIKLHLTAGFEWIGEDTILVQAVNEALSWELARRESTLLSPDGNPYAKVAHFSAVPLGPDYLVEVKASPSEPGRVY